MLFDFCADKCFFFATIRHEQAAGRVGFGVVYSCRGQLAITGLGQLGSILHHARLLVATESPPATLGDSFLSSLTPKRAYQNVPDQTG